MIGEDRWPVFHRQDLLKGTKYSLIIGKNDQKYTIYGIAVQKDVRTLSNFFHVLKNLVKESKNVLTLVHSAITLCKS